VLAKISLFLLILLYTAAGINHFIHPLFYKAIIPPYFPKPLLIVYVSGIIEIVLGFLLIPTYTKKWACILIAFMLILFTPVHIYMLHQAYAVPNYRVSISAAWIRLLIQPILILWVLRHRNKN
jgi:uncharacterized membrane protein